MQLVTRSLVVLGAIALLDLTGRTLAQADASPPSGKQVLEKYVQATGGRAAYEAIKSRVATLKVEMPAMQISGASTLYQQAPDKAAVVTDIQGIGKIEQGMNGQTVWETSQMMGPRLLQGKEKEALTRSLRLNADLEPEKYYDKIETVGTADVDGKPAWKLQLTGKSGTTETRYYDQESGLLIRTEMAVPTQGGEIPVTASTSEYREIDGIKFPYKTTQKMPQGEIVMTVQKMEHNVEIPASRFEPPADVKALLDKPAQPAP